MISELPKLFGRNFAIGFFLPAALIEVAIWRILIAYGCNDFVKEIFQTDLILGASLILFMLWFGSICLMGFNRPLLRLLEGYGWWHPLQFRKKILQNSFKQKYKPYIENQEQIDICRSKGKPLPSSKEDHADMLRKGVTEFPDDPDYILPTRFGNTVRAFEIYSRVVYGIDAIPAWARIQPILSDCLRSLIDEAKSQVDFAVNTYFGSLISLITYIIFAAVEKKVVDLWLPFIFVTELAPVSTGHFGIAMEAQGYA